MWCPRIGRPTWSPRHPSISTSIWIYISCPENRDPSIAEAREGRGFLYTLAEHLIIILLFVKDIYFTRLVVLGKRQDARAADIVVAAEAVQVLAAEVVPHNFAVHKTDQFG